MKLWHCIAVALGVALLPTYLLGSIWLVANAVRWINGIGA